MENPRLTTWKITFIIPAVDKGFEGEKISCGLQRDLDGGKRSSVKISAFAPEPYR